VKVGEMDKKKKTRSATLLWGRECTKKEKGMAASTMTKEKNTWIEVNFGERDTKGGKKRDFCLRGLKKKKKREKSVQ